MIAYITGKNTVGSELKVVIAGVYENINYQWYRSTTFDGIYEPIVGADEELYKILLSDLFIKCLVSSGSDSTFTNVIIVERDKKKSEEKPSMISANIGNGLMLDSPVSGVSGESNISTDFSRINQSIKIILSTAKGEVPMLPDVGCYLYTYLFDDAVESNFELIKMEVRSALASQEPRIKVLDVNVNYNDVIVKDNFGNYYDRGHEVSIKITYQLSGSNAKSSYIYTANVNEEGGE